MVKTTVQFPFILKLLDDDSPVIQKMVRGFLLNHSIDIILNGFLQDQEMNENSGHLLKNILSDIRFELVEKAFLQLVSHQLEDIDLEQAILILAYWNNPLVNIEQVSRQIDQLAEDISFRLPESGHPLAFVDHLSYYLFKKFGFRGNEEDYYHPDNSFLDKVLENRKGIPISLSILTMLVAARLNIVVSGIPMPAHFIVKFEDESDGIYFDPYFSGKIYSREECVAYLEQTRKTPVDEVLAGCSNFDIILRMMRNIHLVYTSYYNEPAKASEILQLIELMEGIFHE